MIGRGTLAVLFAMLLATATRGRIAAADAGTFAIGGSVVNSITGEPVRRASVSLQIQYGPHGGPGNTTATTDAGGRFVFEGLPQGTYILSASHRAFERKMYDGGKGLAIGPSRTDLTISLPPFGVVSGRITDENGDPMVGAAVGALESRIMSGRRMQIVAQRARTDDRGIYRLGSLHAGRYFVGASGGFASATGDGEERTSYPLMYFAGSRELGSAAVIDLAPGGFAGADIRLEPARVHTIRGKVQMTPGAVPTITCARTGGSEMFAAAAGVVRQVSPDGAFEIRDVEPGMFRVTANLFVPPGREGATAVVAVGDADVEGVTLAPVKIAPLDGSIVSEQRDGPALNPASIRLHLRPAQEGPAPVLSAAVSPDLSFRFPEALAGSYRLNAGVPAPYYVKSAMSGGADVLESGLTIVSGVDPAPLSVVLGSNAGQVSGTVKDGEQPASQCVVVLKWRRGDDRTSFVAVADNGGAFSLGSIPPGDYTAYAWRDVSEVEYESSVALARYAGENVTVGEGSKQTVTLKLNRE